MALKMNLLIKWNIFKNKKVFFLISQAVYWLRLCASTTGIQSLVGKLRSCMPCSVDKKRNKRSSSKNTFKKLFIESQKCYFDNPLFLILLYLQMRCCLQLVII